MVMVVMVDGGQYNVLAGERGRQSASGIFWRERGRHHTDRR